MYLQGVPYLLTEQILLPHVYEQSGIEYVTARECFLIDVFTGHPITLTQSTFISHTYVNLKKNI